jgi:hypothetical protein
LDSSNAAHASSSRRSVIQRSPSSYRCCAVAPWACARPPTSAKTTPDRAGLVAGELGDPEVEDLRPLAAGHGGILDDEDVLRLQIAVDDALGVRGAERAADQPHQRQGLEQADRAEPPEPAVQRLTVEPLHDDVRADLGLMAEVEHLDDAGIRDPGHRARLVEEPLDHLFMGRQRRLQHLDRGRPTEQRVLGEVDRAHATLAELVRHPVHPDHGPRYQQDGSTLAQGLAGPRTSGIPACSTAGGGLASGADSRSSGTVIRRPDPARSDTSRSRSGKAWFWRQFLARFPCHRAPDQVAWREMFHL